jgi:hypothetical protein
MVWRNSSEPIFQKIRSRPRIARRDSDRGRGLHTTGVLGLQRCCLNSRQCHRWRETTPSQVGGDASRGSHLDRELASSTLQQVCVNIVLEEFIGARSDVKESRPHTTAQLGRAWQCKRSAVLREDEMRFGNATLSYRQKRL